MIKSKSYKAWVAYKQLGHNISFKEFKSKLDGLKKADVNVKLIYKQLNAPGLIDVGKNRLNRMNRLPHVIAAPDIKLRGSGGFAIDIN